jgi:hypothetical protein
MRPQTRDQPLKASRRAAAPKRAARPATTARPQAQRLWERRPRRDWCRDHRGAKCASRRAAAPTRAARPETTVRPQAQGLWERRPRRDWCRDHRSAKCVSRRGRRSHKGGAPGDHGEASSAGTVGATAPSRSVRRPSRCEVRFAARPPLPQGRRARRPRRALKRRNCGSDGPVAIGAVTIAVRSAHRGEAAAPTGAACPETTASPQAQELWERRPRRDQCGDHRGAKCVSRRGRRSHKSGAPIDHGEPSSAATVGATAPSRSVR